MCRQHVAILRLFEKIINQPLVHFFKSNLFPISSITEAKFWLIIEKTKARNLPMPGEQLSEILCRQEKHLNIGK